MRSYEWCAGFFDGEGSTHRHSSRKNGRRYVSLKVTVAQSGSWSTPYDAPEVLVDFLAIMGIGRIIGPHHRIGHNLKGPSFRFQALGAHAGLVLARMWPWLGSVKQLQAHRVIEELSPLQLSRLPDIIIPNTKAGVDRVRQRR